MIELFLLKYFTRLITDQMLITPKMLPNMKKQFEFTDDPYCQITETKSKNWKYHPRVWRKRNPVKMQKFYFGNFIERVWWKQNPVKTQWYL